MIFSVDPKVFEMLPGYCLGIVVADGFDNGVYDEAVGAMLDEAAAGFAQTHEGANVRELPPVAAFREAFVALGMNPNKYMCAIESLTKRVQKTGALPHINTLVDLGNAVSLKHLVPIGAHDIGKMDPSGFAVRFTTAADGFLPMGAEAPDDVPGGELAYISGNTIKTRRWVWRQSEDGKIDESTSHIFYPLDAFYGVNDDQLAAVEEELKTYLETKGCRVQIGFVDKDCTSFEFA